MRKAAEFFAGIGLVGKALEQEGWRVVFANDIDPKKQLLFERNFPETNFVLEDIANLRGEDIPSIQLATASFPCIDLSLAGNRAGLNGHHSSMFWHFARILSEMGRRRPQQVLIENVTGLLSSHDGKDLRELIQELNSLGYFCDLLVVDAAHFVPQSRPRLFIVGDSSESKDKAFEVGPHPFRPLQLAEFIIKNRDLKWRIRSLPLPLPKRYELDKYLETIDVKDARWWDPVRKAHLFHQMNDLHRQKLQRMSQSSDTNFATVYKRIRSGICRAELRTDGLAGCLRTPRGGSSKQFVIQAGNRKWAVRNMTAREYARLQGAPRFRLDGVPENIALLGFGDAVCVPAVQWVLRYCLPNETRPKKRQTLPKEERRAIVQVCAD